MSRQVAMGAAVLWLGLAVDGAVSPARAEWLPGDPLETLNKEVYALTVWDPDGAGPEPDLLIAGGMFSRAGLVPAWYVAAWDGVHWRPLGDGLPDNVRALTVHNGDLYAGGSFGVYRWVPSPGGWVSLNLRLASYDYVKTLAVFDDGTGPALYAAGNFDTAGSDVVFNNIAKWDGSAWRTLGNGLTGTNPRANALSVFNGELVVGGVFTAAGGASAKNIARWDGTQWSPLGAGMDSRSYPETWIYID